jgi:enoyl-CoA hydratase
MPDKETDNPTSSMVLIERLPSIALVRLNRPDVLNALSPDMLSALSQALVSLDEDESVG